MNRDDILASIRSTAPDLRRRGVERLRLFGSAARESRNAHSDIDVAVRFRAGHTPSLLDLGAVSDIISRSLNGIPVDVVAEPIRDPALKDAVEQDQILAF